MAESGPTSHEPCVGKSKRQVGNSLRLRREPKIASRDPAKGELGILRGGESGTPTAVQDTSNKTNTTSKADTINTTNTTANPAAGSRLALHRFPTRRLWVPDAPFGVPDSPNFPLIRT